MYLRLGLTIYKYFGGYYKVKLNDLIRIEVGDKYNAINLATKKQLSDTWFDDGFEFIGKCKYAYVKLDNKYNIIDIKD